MHSRTADILRDLNPPQRTAVMHLEGPLLVLAGAGSGKTRVITHRIAHLLSSGCPADGMLAITFTNKAAGEMRDRTERLCGMRSPWISTFHSFAARLLRRHIYRLPPYDTSFTICDRDDCRALVKEVLKDQDVDPHMWPPQTVLGEISSIKNTAEGRDSAFGADYLHGQVLRNVYHQYVKRMEERNLLDFDDLLLLLVRLFRTHPDILDRYREQFQHVLVDEYQDTNHVQYSIGKLLSEKSRNICITGDPDQSIYRWRGADINNILNFERDYPDAKIVRLEQNYRSSKNVLHVANALIRHNELRKPKKLWTENPDGEPVRVHRFADEQREAREVASLVKTFLDEGIPAGDIAVFYRLNALSRPIEQELIYANIPYDIVGGLEFFLRKEIKDLLAYLRILANPRDSESLRRIINVPLRGIGRTTLEKLQSAARKQRRGLLEVVLRRELREELSGRQGQAADRFRSLYEQLSQIATGAGCAPLAGRPDDEAKPEAGSSAEVEGSGERDAGEGDPVDGGPETCEQREEPNEQEPGGNDGPNGEHSGGGMSRGAVETILRAVLELTDYNEYLRSAHGHEEAAERVANVSELIGAAVEYDRSNTEGSLRGFLELTAILGDVDRWKRQKDRVSLMTLHSAKGLEFPAVVIVGVEDGILPLLRAMDPDPDIEEERRLLYVGITRAKERLYLTHTASRKRFGKANRAFPSRFLHELPPDADTALEAFEQLEMDVETELSLQQPTRRSRWRRFGELDTFDQRRESIETVNGRSGDRGSPDLYLDQDGLGDDGYEADEDPYPTGCRVWHEEYGEGRVVRTSGFGSRRRVTISFDEAGEKQFVIGYESLHRLR